MKIVVLGGSSDLAKGLVKILDKTFSEIITVDRTEIDFNDSQSTFKLHNLIKQNDPDLIINCVGILGTNTDDYEYVFNANFKSNWDIIRYYISNQSNKKTKFIMIGSSAYSGGRKNYMLYSASKAALYNLFLSASSHFNKTNLLIGLINFPRIRTKMISHLLTPELECMEVDEASEIIVDFLYNLNSNTSIDLGVK